jgi:hypothetical protein
VPRVHGPADPGRDRQAQCAPRRAGLARQRSEVAVREPVQALKGLAALTLALALALVQCVPDAPAAAPEAGLGSRYPLEVRISFDAALFHWLESLTGATLGKTVPGHLQEYAKVFGGFTAEDRAHLEAFARVRLAHAQAPAPPLEFRGMNAMRERLFDGDGAESEVGALAGELSQGQLAALRRSLAWFAPKYEKVWRNGRVPREFLKAARRDPAAARLDALLVRLAQFYGVPPHGAPRPRLLLVPVPDGWGTHAYALTRTMLLEIRAGDRLANQAAVVVHENAHFLFSRLPGERQQRLEAAARAASPAGAAAWATLHEALPTVLGQGVADRMFCPEDWSMGARWYHTAGVDRYAKALLPLLDRILAAGGALDEAFVREAVAAYAPATPPGP